MKKNLTEDLSGKGKRGKMKSVDQITIAKLVADRIGLTLTEVQQVIELEQKYTMDYIKRNRKVVKKNYLTLTPMVIKAKVFKSPLDGKEYEMPARRIVTVRVGSGFKNYISDNSTKKMPEKICRFVDSNGETVSDSTSEE
ncbi:MAG: HU family DNA-binding protein [Acholeplasmatales bacterium]|nr:HU family DNA-binding protein [Acholeplasmatales bacterium]